MGSILKGKHDNLWVIGNETINSLERIYLKYLNSTDMSDDELNKAVDEIINKYSVYYDKVLKYRNSVLGKIVCKLDKIKYDNGYVESYGETKKRKELEINDFFSDVYRIRSVDEIIGTAKKYAICIYKFDNIKDYMPLSEENINIINNKLKSFLECIPENEIEYRINEILETLNNKLTTLGNDISEEEKAKLFNIFDKYLPKEKNDKSL